MHLNLLPQKIDCRYILDSHFRWTLEYIVKLMDGSVGVGSSPRGETLSIFEDRKNYYKIGKILSKINRSKEIKKCISQEKFDRLLRKYRPNMGNNNTFALSQAYLNAVSASLKINPYQLLKKIFHCKANLNRFPIILCNVLNGGLHAYTNPVLSDFSEYLLVPQFYNFKKLVNLYGNINTQIKKSLQKLPQKIVAGNHVYCKKTRDNRVWIEFLLDILDKLDYSKEFSLMIDASAGDLFSEEKKYFFSITDKRKYSQDEFLSYWERLLSNYPIQILEDPFAETDHKNWQRLTSMFSKKIIAGDNLFATDPRRISEGGRVKLASGVLVKPNQVGTITQVAEAIQTTNHMGMIPITSHRSIETESSILTDLTLAFDIPIVKIGLFSDFETIIKLNKMLRYYGNG